MKKSTLSRTITAAIIAFSALLCLTACGDNAQSQSKNSADTTAASTVLTTTPSDESESDAKTTTAKTTTAESKTTTAQTTAQTTTVTEATTTMATAAQTTSTHVHTYSDATCTLAKTCSCGEIAGIPLGHNYSDATCTSPQICSRCGETNGEPLGHDYLEATCTEAEMCSACGETNCEPLGHDYVDNTCSRCGQVDPDSLPVALGEIFLMDSEDYEYINGSFTDSFGNTYNDAHAFVQLYKGPHCTFSLQSQYSSFSGSIVATTVPEEDWTYHIEIYVDDELVFSKTNFSKTSGKVDFSIDVTNGQILKIAAGTEQRFTGSNSKEIAIVNAQLTK